MAVGAVVTDNNAVFTLTGAILSFCASTFMFYVLVTNKASRVQMRPRMLIILAFLDAIAALCLIIGAVTSIVQHDDKDTDYFLKNLW